MMTRAVRTDIVNLRFAVPSLTIGCEPYNRRVERIWREATGDPINFRYLKGSAAFEVSGNWADVYRRIRRQSSSIEKFWSGQYSKLNERGLFAACAIPLEVRYFRAERKRDCPPEGQLAELYLTDCFLAFNLACPGSFSLPNTCIREQSEKTWRNVSPKLSAEILQLIQYEERPASWEVLGDLGLRETIEWVSHVRPGFELVARDAVQRALFAVLCATDDAEYSPASIMWLSHALEALFDTTIGQNLSAMRERARLILQLQETEVKQFNKRMREFYELRSSFVHGGFPIGHPAGWPDLDPHMEEYWDKVSRSVAFGVSLTWALIRKLVKNRAQAFRFHEKLSCETIEQR